MPVGSRKLANPSFKAGACMASGTTSAQVGVTVPDASTAEQKTHAVHEKLAKGPGKTGALVFVVVLLAGLIYIGAQIARDLGDVVLGSTWPYVLLGTALLVALGFEFVNGFHDTANAVATVIYTHSLDPQIAVVWSGFWNFFGVVTSSGLVAFTIVSLLPVEVI